MGKIKKERSGNFSAWSATTTGGGDLSVSTQAAISGTYGMKALINDNGAIYVTDWKPFEETRYRARFYFDPNTITMASNNAHYLLYALNRSNVVVARVELRRYNSTYQVRAAVVNDSTTWSSTAWTTISDAPHKLEIDWKAATAAGANNGGITFWVDGVQKGTFTNIDNDTRKVDYIQFGAVAGIDTGTRGTEYFDAFVSRRVSYIGMQFPGSVLLGMAGLGTQNEQLLAGLEVARKVLAAPAPIQQPVQISNMTPVANPPAAGLAATQQSQLITTTVVISYTYDPLNRLTAADYDGGMYFHYTYDAVGNRVVEATNVLTSVYGYDNLNRLVYYNGLNYAWDDNGNLLHDGVNSYTYDRANRLIGVSGVGISVNYSYNGLGDRLSETANSQTTHYTMDLNAGLTQVLQDGTNTYLYGAGRVAQYGANGPEYYLGDALGSVRQMVDANGNVTMGRMYKPYGGVLSSTGSGATSYGFTNEWTDASTGDVYLRARWYAVGQGRFLTKDTWEGDYRRAISLNKWLYAESNPINFSDSSGLCVMCGPGDFVKVDARQNDGSIPIYQDGTYKHKKIGFLLDNQAVTVLDSSPGASFLQATEFLRKVGTITQYPPYYVEGYVRNKYLLDNCGKSGAAFGCLPYPVFPNHWGDGTVRKGFGFGPNSYAKEICGDGQACIYSALRGLHNGLDFPGRQGDVLIWAGATEGQVSNITKDGFGDAVPNITIAYNGAIVTYGHVDLSHELVKRGRTVRPGQIIAGIQEDHLHFGYRSENVIANPLFFFSQELQDHIVANLLPYPEGYGPYYLLGFRNDRFSTNFWTKCDLNDIFLSGL